MTDAEHQELEWHRDWRHRLGSAFRLWRDPHSYENACKRWGELSDLFKEQPPASTPPDGQFMATRHSKDEAA